MKKKLLFFALALAACVPAESLAQASPGTTKSSAEQWGGASREPSKMSNLFVLDRALAKKNVPGGLQQLRANSALPRQARALAPLRDGIGRRLVTASGRELWGNLVYRSDWNGETAEQGIYGFDTTSPAAQTARYTQSGMQANGKGSLFAGKLNLVNYKKTDYGLSVYFYQYDVKTWKKLKSQTVYDDGVVALETATDQATGKVYGQFYNAGDAAVKELGVIDYTGFAPKRTTISTLAKTYVALGITKEQKLYGVATDGNLYRIDTATGEETLVGATGVNVAYDEAGQYYLQSGEIDQETGVFYWAAVRADKSSALYTVDLQTGAASKVADFEHGEQFYDLYIPDAASAPAAPAAVTDAVASFPNGSLSGTISFTAPEKSNAGGALDGELDYCVTVGRDTLATGKAAPGARVEAAVTSPCDGKVLFTITTANSEGTSEKLRLETFVGYDSPKKVTKLKFNIDNATGLASVTWAAPTSGQNGGYLGDLVYDVVRYPDSVKVASHIAETSFSETLTNEFATTYYYTVTAYNGEKAGEEARTAKVVFGNVYTTPYEAKLNTNDEFKRFTVIDANGDGKKWAYWSSMARYSYGSKDADDWLVTPAIRLEKGRFYKISVKVGAYGTRYTERIEVKAGRGNTAADMTMSVVEAKDFSTSRNQYETLEGELVANETGDYYLGFHALSTAEDGYYLYLKDITVDGGTSQDIPGAVTDLKVEPDPTGLLKAKVSFKAPAVNEVGGALGSLAKVTVKREGKEVKVFSDNVKPGASLEFDDTVEKNGANTYVVRAFSEAGPGDSVAVEAYVGVDVPRRPKNVLLHDNVSSVKMTWDAVSAKGLNGGIVRPQDVWYYIYDSALSGTLELRDSVQGLSYDFDINTSTGAQKLLQYAVAAKNAAGTSYESYSTGLVAGKPYALPFHDSFAKGKLAYDLWWLEQTGTGAFELYTDKSSDNDGGCFVFRSYLIGDEASVNTGKISLQGAVNPELSFYHFAKPGNRLKLYADVYKASGETDSILVADFSAAQGEASWQKAVVDMRPYKAERFVVLKLRVAAKRSGDPLYLDNVTVRDVLEDDLAAAIQAPESVEKGKSAKVSVVVSNIGLNAASGYTVTLSANGKEIGSASAKGALPAGGSATYQFDYATSVFDNFSKAELKAAVDYALDLDETNNTASASMDLLSKEFSAPANVEASGSEQAVEVRWNAPLVFSRNFTDSFEDYNRGDTTNIGNWLTVDMDKGEAGAVLTFDNGKTALHYHEPYAFTVFNPEKTLNGLTTQYPGYKPHTGEQYLANVYGGDFDQQQTYNADNWLISPALSGESQTLRFYARNYPTESSDFPETFDVLYSTGSTKIADFVKVGQTHTVSDGAWNKIEAELPEGALRFAVHHNTVAKNTFFFSLDDFTYRAVTDAPVGYNVYRDREKVAYIPFGTTAFSDAGAPEGEHVYAVSAVYADGESAAVSAKPVIVTGIESVGAEASGRFDVYTTDGRLVGKGLKSLKKLRKGVYIVNGSKLIVK